MGQPDDERDFRYTVWLRPSQLFRGKYELFEGIEPDDIKQGTLGVCYYLATISSLAEKNERIPPLFPFYSKELGFFVVRLLVHGKPTNIPVDDYIPCNQGTNEPYFTRPNGKEIWVMILEKAWAKNFGTYMESEGMDPYLMMEDVTMAPSKRENIKDVNALFDTFMKYDKMDYIVVLASFPDNVPEGIAEGHAYSLLSVYDIDGVKLLKIRNPWGAFEW